MDKNLPPTLETMSLLLFLFFFSFLFLLVFDFSFLCLAFLSLDERCTLETPVGGIGVWCHRRLLALARERDWATIVLSSSGTLVT